MHYFKSCKLRNLISWICTLDLEGVEEGRKVCDGCRLKICRWYKNRSKANSNNKLTCPLWRHGTNSQLRRLQVFQSKCLCIIAGEPCYISNLELHKDLEVLYISEHVKNRAQSFDSKISDAENLLIHQL